MNVAPFFPFTFHLCPTGAVEEIFCFLSAISINLPKLDSASPQTYLPSPFPPLTIQEVDMHNKLRKLKTSRSFTPTDLPMKMYKKFAPEADTLSVLSLSPPPPRTPVQVTERCHVTPLSTTPSPQSFNDHRTVVVDAILRFITFDLFYHSCQ